LTFERGVAPLDAVETDRSELPAASGFVLIG
jgi:hypothetical protein